MNNWDWNYDTRHIPHITRNDKDFLNFECGDPQELIDQLNAYESTVATLNNVIADRGYTIEELQGEVERLKESLKNMIWTHGMHGPCRNNSCSECDRYYKQAKQLLKAIGEEER